MQADLKALRREAAEAGRSYLSKNLSWEEFMNRFSESEDDLVSNLVDLIEHEPKRGGFLGVKDRGWAEYEALLIAAIAALELGTVA
jgi:hypothetical protein